MHLHHTVSLQDLVRFQFSRHTNSIGQVSAKSAQVLTHAFFREIETLTSKHGLDYRFLYQISRRQFDVHEFLVTYKKIIDIFIKLP